MKSGGPERGHAEPRRLRPLLLAEQTKRQRQAESGRCGRCGLRNWHGRGRNRRRSAGRLWVGRLWAGQRQHMLTVSLSNADEKVALAGGQCASVRAGEDGAGPIEELTLTGGSFASTGERGRGSGSRSRPGTSTVGVDSRITGGTAGQHRPAEGTCQTQAGEQQAASVDRSRLGENLPPGQGHSVKLPQPWKNAEHRRRRHPR